MMLNIYHINYGFSTAKLWTSVPKDEAVKRFYYLANQCFGIRKSIISEPYVSRHIEDTGFPPGTDQRAYEMLVHGFPSDTIIWDSEGRKILNEWGEDETVEREAEKIE